MKLVVLVKHVPEALDELPYNGDLTVDRDAARGAMNEPDTFAVEQAMRIARRRIDVQVCALTMGPAVAARTLYRALALGADEGVHVLDDALHGSDALATSRVLAAAIRRLGFDLVLCGAASRDSGMSVIPAMVAERLGVPVVCHADSLRVGLGAAAEIIVSCDDGAAIEELSAGLPAVVSVTDRCEEPRYPSFPAIAEARHKLVRTWSLADLGICPDEVGLCAAATAVRRVMLRPRPRSARLVGGEPRAAAAELADFLAENQFI